MTDSAPLDIAGSPGGSRLSADDLDWEPGDADLKLEPFQHGGSRAQLTLSVRGHAAAGTVEAATELTLEDLVLLRDWADESITFWRAREDA